MALSAASGVSPALLSRRVIQGPLEEKKTYIFILEGTFYVPYMKLHTNQCGSWTVKSVIEKQRETLWAIILSLDGLFQGHNLEQFSKDCPK